MRPVRQKAPGSCGDPIHTPVVPSIDSKYYWICTKAAGAAEKTAQEVRCDTTWAKTEKKLKF